MKFVVGPKTMLERSLFLSVLWTGTAWKLDDRAAELDALILVNGEELPLGCQRIRVEPRTDQIVRRNYSA